MRDNSKDRTIERNYIQKWRFLVREYELVKAKCHPQFRFVQDFYAFHDTSRQTFAKYYNRYRLSGSDNGLLPLNPNPPKDTDGRREGSGRGWVRELQGRWPGLMG